LWHDCTVFDPAMVQPPVFDGSRDGGFGVYIIAHCVDEVRYVRDEQGENCICLMKFLMGRSLSNNLYNLGLFTLCQQALRTLGVDLTMVEESERDAALGHGGLGRLAACFLDSLATLDMPGYGYGIHYEYGLFQQEIHNGYQQE